MQMPRKSTSDCVQLYYFWKKLSVHYKATHLLKDWSDLRAGKRLKLENDGTTATATRSLLVGSTGSGGHFTTAASIYSAKSPSGVVGHPLSLSSSSFSAVASNGISKLTTAAAPGTPTTMSAPSPSSTSSSSPSTGSHHSHQQQHHHHHHPEVRPHICEMPDCSAVNINTAILLLYAH